MKRVIKFWNKYDSDGFKFSDCSTEYEVMPVLVSNDSDSADLLQIAGDLGLETLDAVQFAEVPRYGFRALQVTHAVKIGTKTVTRNSFRGETETFPVWLGFITLPERGPLPVLETVDAELTAEQAYEICNQQAYGVSDVGETVEGEIVLVKSGWNYFHEIRLIGYSIESFETQMKVTEHGFDDDTSRCDDCGKFDSRDDGYNYNFREFDGDWLGVNCGCYNEACQNNIEPFINSPEKCMELTVAEKLEATGGLEHVERYIGGMCDGRGGRWKGEYVSEGEPETILKALLEAEPEGKFVFTHDESGQFQTYFSVWRVLED